MRFKLDKCHLLIKLAALFAICVAMGYGNSELRAWESPIPMQQEYRAWQGVAVNDVAIYVFTDRNENFELENIISEYSHDGEFRREIRNAYTGIDSQGYFMSFGDGNTVEGRLLVTAYNAVSGGRPPYVSRVLIYSLPDIVLVGEYNIGDGIAESVTLHNNSYWITYHDQMILREFDNDFEHIGTYTLSEPMGPYGGYQGAAWVGDDILLQMHGPNWDGLDPPSKGLDRYHFSDSEFVFVGTEIPLSYGSGQGVSIYNNRVFQNDRPANGIVSRTFHQSYQIYLPAVR